MGLNGTPENYEYWLSEALKKTKADYPSQERLVFINAWNEWAEGCHLEPCRKWGRNFLEATLRAKTGQSKLLGWSSRSVPPELASSEPPAPGEAPPSLGKRANNIWQNLRTHLFG